MHCSLSLSLNRRMTSIILSHLPPPSVISSGGVKNRRAPYGYVIFRQVSVFRYSLAIDYSCTNSENTGSNQCIVKHYHGYVCEKARTRERTHYGVYENPEITVRFGGGGGG